MASGFTVVPLMLKRLCCCSWIPDRKADAASVGPDWTGTEGTRYYSAMTLIADRGRTRLFPWTNPDRRNR